MGGFGAVFLNSRFFFSDTSLTTLSLLKGTALIFTYLIVHQSCGLGHSRAMQRFQVMGANTVAVPHRPTFGLKQSPTL